jgi:transcriptional regulator with XRE-family HTH domain
MPTFATIRHPYWTSLGAAARTTRLGLQISQAKIALLAGLSVREYAALESGFIPFDVADALGRLDLSRLDGALGWDDGTSRSQVEKALTAAMGPNSTPDAVLVDGDTLGVVNDRSSYPAAAWARLGKAVQASRMAEKLSRNQLAYGIKSSSKTIMRLEEGRIYGDPRTAPPGDYNSERYILRRLAFLEMFLGWEQGAAAQILEGGNVATVSPAA